MLIIFIYIISNLNILKLAIWWRCFCLLQSALFLLYDVTNKLSFDNISVSELIRADDREVIVN